MNLTLVTSEKVVSNYQTLLNMQNLRGNFKPMLINAGYISYRMSPNLFFLLLLVTKTLDSDQISDEDFKMCLENLYWNFVL